MNFKYEKFAVFFLIFEIHFLVLEINLLIQENNFWKSFSDI